MHLLRSALSFSVVTIAATCAITSASYAELPPDAYRSLQARSPEALTLTIEEVRVARARVPDGQLLRITADAKVDRVRRSKSGLKPGAAIQIKYARLERDRPMPGPSEPEVIVKGRSYPAFLSKEREGSAYTIAAGGFSFRSLDRTKGE